MDGEEYEPEEMVQADPPDTASYFDTPFTGEQLQNVHRLRSSSYKEEVRYVLEETTLYPRTKKAILSLVDQFLSEMSILANYPSVELALLDYDIAELGMKHSYYPTDLKNPMLFHILELIRTQFKSILTRAHGPDRERVINGRQSLETRNVSKQEPLMVPRPQKKKNILGW